jgi:hypothetical protein
LEYVAHPSLIPDFADDIVIALVRHATDDDYSLALSYVYSVQPILKSAHALELLFSAMARTNVTEALYYSRTHPEHTRELLFHRLVASVLDVEEGLNPANELIRLSLDELEDGWLQEYLTSGSGKKLRAAKDVLLMRYMASNRFSEASKLRSNSDQFGPITASVKTTMNGLD